MKRIKEVWAVIVAACLTLTAVPVYANDGEIHIQTAYDLKELAVNCTLDSWSRGVTVVLDNNINLSGSGFTPIPTFAGTFEGNGYTISGLSITANEPVQGLFRYIQEGAAVKDLTVKGYISESEGKDTFGGIAGVNNGSILNCTFEGSLDGDSILGGIAGINESAGRIGSCVSESVISSQKYTGGIAGENFGTILKCVNRSKINTSSKESKLNLEDISLDNLDTSMDETAKPLSGHTDTGGIAGYSGGIIQSCQNYGQIGYQHMGYNIGGIAGRQGGYISGCINHAQVLGRKDVGGIVGQAEPHIILRYSSDSLQQLDAALKEMQSLVNNMLDDIDGTTSAVSNRVSSISGYASSARDSSKSLLDQTSDYLDDVKDFANENIDEINDVSARITDAFDRLVPVIDDMKDASTFLSDAFDELNDAMDNFDDIEDISDEAADKLSDAMDHFNSATDSINSALDKIKEAVQKVLDSAVSGDPEEINAALNDLKTGTDELAAALSSRGEALNELKEAIQSIEGWPIDDEKKSLIFEAIGSLADSTTKMGEAAGQIGAALSGFNSAVDIDWAVVKDAFSSISDVLDDFNNASSEAKKAVKNISEALKDAKGLSGAFNKIADGVSDALDSMTDSSDNLTSALKKARNIVRDLADKDPIEFSTLDSDYHLDTQDLYSALTGISDEIEGLNSDIKASGDTMTADLRAINNKFNEIMRIMIDALTADDEDKTLSDLAMDTSDTDIYKATDGKVEGCSNMGKVEADLNVGGIVGSMAIEYDLDPEDDISSIGNTSLNFRYETKDIVLGCKNYGTIVSKKNCVGGIVGRMDLGTAADCEGYGFVQSTSGDYAGGIAGLSESSIRSCYAKCVLSGNNRLGGIAGKADTVTDCRSIIDIQEHIGMTGAIAGEAKDLEDIRGNAFINTGWAGIGGISYEGRAVPVSYDDMKKSAGLPEDFLEFTIKFRANGSLIKTVPFTFGEDLSGLVLPEIPEKDGFYASWPDTDLSHMTFSTVIEAEYKPWVSVLTSDETGENTKKPLALAEGTFTDGAKITAQYGEADKLPSGAISGDGTVIINVSLSGDGIDENSVTTIRLLKGGEDVKLWKLEDDKWHKAGGEENGSYIITDMDGMDAVYCIAPAADSVKEYIAVGTVILIGAAFVISKVKKAAGFKKKK